MPINKFDETDNYKQSSTSNEDSGSNEKEYQSIRQKNRKKYSKSDGEKGEKYSFSFTFDERSNYYSNFEESKEVLMDKKFKLDQYKKENIDKFLFTKAPVPRSYRMIGNLIKLKLLKFLIQFFQNKNIQIKRDLVKSRNFPYYFQILKLVY